MELGTMTVKLLAQVADNEPIEVGTIELPIHTATVERHGPVAQAIITAPDGDTIEKAIAGPVCNCKEVRRGTQQHPTREHTGGSNNTGEGANKPHPN